MKAFLKTLFGDPATIAVVAIVMAFEIGLSAHHLIEAARWRFRSRCCWASPGLSVVNSRRKTPEVKGKGHVPIDHERRWREFSQPRPG